ncbi:MAG: DUF4349 domain-containing protein [Chloroflexi bacterium]|nr:DUF4349 domain-containing protein [Chloroflexota bacterium]
MSSTQRRTWIIVGVVGGGLALLILFFVIGSFLGAGGLAIRAAPGFGGDAESAMAPEEDFFFDDEMREFEEAASGESAPAPIDQDGQSQTTQVQQRLIIRNGSINLSVADTQATRQDIEELVAQYAEQGAFVVSAEEFGGRPGRQPDVNMTIRVPSSAFDEVMNELAGMAVEVISRNETAQDVTEEYVDLQARIESLTTARDRLLEIVENADTTEELLLAEAQLTQREAEIDALVGRLQFLADSARLSLISISLQPDIPNQPVDTSWRPIVTVREAFDDLVDSLRGFGDFLIYFAIAVLPWLVVAGLVIYGVVRFIVWRVQVGRDRRATAADVD